ncbi:Uncharacterised protein (plasmid) [Tsukamurella tyrosinosolvens]|uniref:Helix-turn-helix domain-containing protein n=1 Tax=Tsukamurella tyrosinosolvens TaxID=57704 RepID=A0A1H4QPE8_TSUTY|nr:helix-turn-helix domain-containing protein [Tsukamurella tyrosinosolvens]SEC21388.1 hypothetical protein SAMN04489793_1807 [Tsukamurella tyrosinosolvens]VEH92542.1 Uncharacterised protein [Tsukamurella tyrosinosolvens]
MTSIDVWRKRLSINLIERTALTPEDVATRLGGSARKVRQMMADELMPGFRWGGSWRVWDTDLALYEKGLAR